MENIELLEKLNLLEKKIYTLVVKHNSLQKQLETAISENLEFKEIIKNQKEELNNFQNQQKFNKLVTSIMAGTESTAGLKKKLNEYIEDIDKCIAHLSKSNID